MDVLPAEGVEHYSGVDAIEEFGSEEALDLFEYLVLHALVADAFRPALVALDGEADACLTRYQVGA